MPVSGPDGHLISRFSDAPWFMVADHDKDNNSQQQKFIENPYLDLPRRKGLAVGEWLLAFEPDQLVFDEFRHGDSVALSILKAGGVDFITELPKSMNVKK